MKLVPASVIKKFSRQLLVAKKHSPHIFFGLGVAGTLASTVLACRATLKLSGTLDEVQRDIKMITDPTEESEWTTQLIALQNEDPQKAQLAKSTATLYVYGRSGLKIAKLYAPAIIVGTAAIVALTGSHVQLSRRNSALMAAYAAVSQAYANYREKVRAELGEEKELELYQAATAELVNSCQDDNVLAKDPHGCSQYARFFDEYSRFWERDPEKNRMYLEIQQRYLNHRLTAYGHVFLNEVYDAIGVDRSPAGAVVGWLKEGDGDSYISFGMFEARNSRFIEGSERSILLDFNVDGIIYDKI